MTPGIVLIVSLLAQAAPADAQPTAEELIKKLDANPDAKTKDKPFEIAASMGKLYFSQGRYADAITYFDQALVKAEPLRTLYQQELKAAGNKPLPPAGSVGCAPGADVTVDVLLQRAQEKAKGGAHAAAASCARSAMHGVVEVDTQLGHSKFLTGDADGALKAYDRALDTFPSSPDARYSRAALLLDTKGDDVEALKTAQADLEQFLKDYGASPRAPQAKRFLERVKAAIAAGGLTKVADAAPPAPAPSAGPDAPPALSPETIAAFQSQPNTPEAQAQRQKTIETAEGQLAHGQYQQALQSYVSVMPFEPQNPRVRAGMAWTLVRLGKPMAPRVWGVALSSPDDVAALGDRLKAAGDAEGAKLLWQKLAQDVPGYGEKLKGRL